MSKQAENIPALLVNKYTAAAMLGVEPVTVDRWTASGVLIVTKMPSTGKVGRPRNMYAVDDLKRFIAAHRTRLSGPDIQPEHARRSRGRKRAGSELAHSSAADILAMEDTDDTQGGAQ